MDDWQGEVDAGLDPEIFAKVDLPAMLDPDQAIEMLHWGSRNLIYRVELRSAAGRQVAVKLTRNQGWVRRLQRRYGSGKAERAWRMAREFTAAGVPTPRPLAWVESNRPDGPSLFVTELEPDAVEVRYVLRALTRSAVAEEFPWLEPASLWRACGRVLARTHASGLWHRDASIGNLVVRRGSDPPEVLLVDLNRARKRPRLSWPHRLRDLCRLPLDSRTDQIALLTGYLGATPTKRILLAYRFFKAVYFGRLATKRLVRNLLPRRRRRRQHPYEHIPLPQTGDTRQRVTWDRLTEQPFQHASPGARAMTRLHDVPLHARDLARALLAAPRMTARSAALKKEQFAHAVHWPGVGVGLTLGPEEPGAVLRMLADLGAAHVLLRVYPWRDPDREPALARELAAAGLDITFALPQNREMVTDLDRWRRSVRVWGRELSPYGNRFQIGQAINRSKWGVWRSDEYVALVEAAREELPGGAELIGPAVIDFEPLAMAVALTQPGLRAPFAITSSLLYVDRRGAPENRQMGFDAVDKARLMKALGAIARAGSDRLWVTEVNWPLAAGPHSPAGRAVAVDEQTQADYAVRYCVLLLASGMVERVYWWQLIARGYGLVDRSVEGHLRRRPAFTALATLSRQLAGTSFERRLEAPPGAWLLQFVSSNGERAVVAWSESSEQGVQLPGEVEVVYSRDGEVLAEGDEDRSRITGAPRYYWLKPE